MEWIVNRLCLITGIAAIWNHVFLAGLYNGVGVGAQSVSEYLYVSPGSRGSGMWISHGDPYYVLGSHVVTMSWVLIAFVILKVFENGWFTRLITFSFLVISILLWINIHLIRSEYLSDSEKYLDAIRQSSEYHWAVFIFLGLSLALQGVSVVYAVKKKREVPKGESYP